MDNRDLFDFPFVDRTNEQATIESFLSENSPGKVLWLTGRSGCGKTFLIEHIKKRAEGEYEFAQVYANTEINEEDQHFWEKLLQGLQKNADMTFVEFLKTHYDSLLDIPKQLVTGILKLNNIDVKAFADLLFDNTKLIIHKNEQKQTASRVIFQYIDAIIGERKLLLVIDNVSRLEKRSVDLLVDIVHTYLTNAYIKFILITTDEDLERYPETGETICEKLPFIPLNLQFFNSSTYFKEILFSIFDLSAEDKKQIDLIFQCCDGSPAKLKTIIRNLLLKEKIRLSGDNRKAVVNLAQSKEYFDYRHSNFSLSEYGFEQALLLLLLARLNIPVTQRFLEHLYKYIGEHQFKMLLPPFSQAAWMDTFRSLLMLNILRVDLRDTSIRFTHDSIPASIIAQADTQPTLAQFPVLLSESIYSFLQTAWPKIQDGSLPEDDYELLLALHSQLAQCTGWEKINYQYGERFYKQGKYYDASKIFLRLTNTTKLSRDEALAVGTSFYETGLYEKSHRFLQEYLAANTVEGSFAFCIMASKIYNILFEKQEALVWIDRALQCCVLYSEEYVLASNLKFYELLENSKPGQREQALELFREIKTHFDGQADLPAALGRLFRNSSDYHKDEKAEELLAKAVQIARHYNDDFEYAFSTNNLGFEYFRQYKMPKAESHFATAAGLLQNIKPHEASYALNNLGTAHMVQEKYPDAVECFMEGLFTNRSAYAELALQVNLMLCYYLTGQFGECGKIFTSLCQSPVVHKTKDRTILRKVYNGLAFTADYTAETTVEKRKSYALKGYKYSKGTSSLYKAAQQLAQFDASIPIPKLVKTDAHYAYYTRQPYDFWLLTYSHD